MRERPPPPPAPVACGLVPLVCGFDLNMVGPILKGWSWVESQWGSENRKPPRFCGGLGQCGGDFLLLLHARPGPPAIIAEAVIKVRGKGEDGHAQRIGRCRKEVKAGFRGW